MFMWYDCFSNMKYFVSGPFNWTAEFKNPKPNFCSWMVPPTNWECE